MQAGFKLFESHFHGPPSGIGIEDFARAFSFEIGHNQFDFLRPFVLPSLREYDCDITNCFQLRAANEDPIVPAPLIWRVRSDPSITRLGQMPGQVAQMRAVFQFPRACESESEAPLQTLDKPQIGLGGKASIRHHDYAPAPCGRSEAAQHLSKENVLMPFAFGIKHFTTDRYA